MVKVAVGIIKKENKILIAERPAGKPYSGYWEFPGGKLEENESGEAALKRELYEELGIEVLAANAWFEHTYTYPDKTVSLEIWLVTAFSGDPQSKEKQSIRWVTLPEMLNFPLLEGNGLIVERMKSCLTNKGDS